MPIWRVSIKPTKLEITEFQWLKVRGYVHFKLCNYGWTRQRVSTAGYTKVGSYKLADTNIGARLRRKSCHEVKVPFETDILGLIRMLWEAITTGKITVHVNLKLYGWIFSRDVSGDYTIPVEKIY